MFGITDSRLSSSGIGDLASLFLKPESYLLVCRSWQFCDGLVKPTQNLANSQTPFEFSVPWGIQRSYGLPIWHFYAENLNQKLGVGTRQILVMPLASRFWVNAAKFRTLYWPSSMTVKRPDIS